jgi:hypothetical protein
MKSTAKPPAIRSAEELASALVSSLRNYDRNCRCPNCSAQSIDCTECDWCLANLRKRMADLLSPELATRAQPVANYTLDPERSVAMIPLMTPTSRTTKLRKPKLHATSKKKTIKTMAKKMRTPRLLRKPHATPKPRPAGGDSDRGFYLRLPSAAAKAQVQAAAKDSNVSMNAYAVAAILDWLKEGKKPILEMPAAKAS